MAVTKAQKMRLGIFVISGLVVFIGGLVVLAGMRLGEVRESYLIRYDDGNVSLSGLDVGSPVKYSGIQVGRVDAIRIDPNDVGVIIVEISLHENTPVAEDTQANLGSQGITGLKYIELTRGSAKARIRKPGEEIPAGSSALDDLSNQAGVIAEKVSTTLDNLNAITGPDMKDRIAGVLDRTNKLLDTADATISENREQLRTITENLATASGKFDVLAEDLAGVANRLNTMMEDATPRTRRILEETAKLTRNLRETSVALDGLIKDTRKAMGPEGVQKLLDRGNLLVAQSRENLVESLAYLRETAENMSDFSRRVREDPSLLLITESTEE